MIIIKKRAISAIKKNISDFNEDFLTEIAYNEKDFNSILTVYLFYKKISHLCIRDFSEVIKNNKEIQENIKNKVLLYINT